MTAQSPTAPPSPSALPVIAVRGATSRRRHVAVAATAILPILTVLVATFASPIESATWTIAIQVGSPVAVAATWGVIAVRSWPPLARVSRHVVATLIGIAWSAAAAMVVLVGAAEPRWDLWRLGIVVLAGFVGLWLAWWAAGLRYGTVGPIVVPRAAQTSASERTAWSGTSVRASNLVMWLVLAAMSCFFLVMSLPVLATQAWLVVIVIAASVSAIPLAVRVTVDRRGLRVRALLLGIPLVRVPLDRVASAAAGIVEEGHWGNGSTVADRELVSIVHRSGPALIVTRTDGSMVVVSAPRPHEAAGVLETLRAQAAHAHG